jgi:6-phospho-beta-glucosidase
MPLALAQEYNGFNDRRVMDAFIRYGKKMIDCYGDRVKYWLTFNEQNIFHMPEAFRISGYMKGENPARAVPAQHIMVAALTEYLHQTKPGKLMGGCWRTSLSITLQTA